MGKFYKIKNLTPHQIKILLGGGAFTFDPSEQCARIIINEKEGSPLMGIPVSYVDHGEVVELPEPEHGTAYIVSQMVAQARKDRGDLFFPLGLVRDEQTHRVLGACKLGQIKKEEE